MADDSGVAVPLAEQLRSVPQDAVLRIDTPNALGCMDTRSIPVGRLCHEAADAMARGVAMQEHTGRGEASERKAVLSISDLCPRCLRDGIKERKEDCTLHRDVGTVAAPAEGQPQTASAWMHDEDSDRVISAAQKFTAMRDGGASASSVARYSIPLGRLDAFGVPAEGQPTGNRCGCNHWLKPVCPERHCSWKGKRPVDAGRALAEGQPGTAGGKEGGRG